MISLTPIRTNECRYQDLHAAVARDRLVNEARRASPAAPRTTSAGRVHALACRAVAALAAVHAFGANWAAEA